MFFELSDHLSVCVCACIGRTCRFLVVDTCAGMA